MKRIFSIIIAAAIGLGAVFVPATSAQAGSIYDVAALSNLRNMVNAMTYYAYLSPGASLMLIDKDQNQLQGSVYNSFLSNCGFFSKPVGEREFLSVPIPSTSPLLPSLGFCYGQMTAFVG